MVTAVTIAAFLSTTAISLAPNVILFLFPDYKPSKEGINPLAIGQALAAGGLLGDVFLHTLPHTLEHDNGEVVGLAVLAGFVVFLLFDILVRSFDDGGHDHHDHHNDSHSKNNNKNNNQRNFTLTSAVVLNLAADSLHNFTDGIAIGASFAGTVHDTSSSMFGQIQELLHSRGGLASLAVLFHEIPHELGDYSILVGAGMTKSQAIMAQFSTAIAAYCGTFVGLYGMQTMKDYLGSDLMVPFTAGGFVYLATVTILPNLLECKVGRRARISQIVAFLVGIGFMYGVALLEHAGGSCGHAHGHGHGHDHHGHGVEFRSHIGISDIGRNEHAKHVHDEVHHYHHGNDAIHGEHLHPYEHDHEEHLHEEHVHHDHGHDEIHGDHSHSHEGHSHEHGHGHKNHEL
mmetsp:Transcript_16463/g.31195  ORF Transcript_16463/g.31195 Transcript_16463/m.31195 type:complete len:401 (-) Transcript_16463:44-1246(-)